MIIQLTSGQDQKVKEYYNTYLAKGLSTIPSNKLIAEKAMKRMYKLMNEKEPKICWVKSPTELIDLVKKNVFLYSSLDSSLRSSFRSSLHSSLDSSLHSSLDSSLYSSLHSSLDSSLHSSLCSSLYSSLHSSLDSSLYSSLYWGQFNGNWISFYKYCNEVLGIKYNTKENEKLDLWIDMTECSCFFIFKGVAILMEHPKEMHVDNNGKSHNILDYAIKFQDGTGIYAVHGNNENDLDCNRLMEEKKITNLEYLESKSLEKEVLTNN